ncbi:hypothetical protein HN446_05185 [bacterium]|jgi:hypothetical protein|nr:hypothetical protein [bacterium]
MKKFIVLFFSFLISTIAYSADSGLRYVRTAQELDIGHFVTFCDKDGTFMAGRVSGIVVHAAVFAVHSTKDYMITDCEQAYGLLETTKDFLRGGKSVIIVSKASEARR